MFNITFGNTAESRRSFGTSEGNETCFDKSDISEKSMVNLHCSNEEKATTLGSSYREVRKIEG